MNFSIICQIFFQILDGHVSCISSCEKLNQNIIEISYEAGEFDPKVKAAARETACLVEPGRLGETVFLLKLGYGVLGQ